MATGGTTHHGVQPGLRVIRASGRSITDVARDIDVSAPHLVAALHGRILPNAETRARLPDALGVTSTQVFTAEVLARRPGSGRGSRTRTGHAHAGVAFTPEQHRALGLRLFDIFHDVQTLATVLTTRYGVRKQPGTVGWQALDAVDKLRSQLEEQLHRDHPGDFCPHVYYPGRESERAQHRALCGPCGEYAEATCVVEPGEVIAKLRDV